MNIRKQMPSAAIGGVVGAILFMIVLFVISRFSLQVQDMFSFIVLTVTIVIAAYTVLGAVILPTAWNDIDERAEKIFAKYEERAEQNVSKKGEEIQRAVIQAISQKQQELTDQLAQNAGRWVKIQGMVFALSLIGIGVLMLIQHFKQKAKNGRSS